MTVRLVFCRFNQNVFCNITCLVNRSCCKHVWAYLCLWDTRLIDSSIYHLPTPGLQNKIEFESFLATSHTENETKKQIFHMLQCSRWIVSDCGWGGCCLLVSPGLCGDISLHQYHWCWRSGPLKLFNNGFLYLFTVIVAVWTFRRPYKTPLMFAHEEKYFHVTATLSRKLGTTSVLVCAYVLLQAALKSKGLFSMAVKNLWFCRFKCRDDNRINHQLLDNCSYRWKDSPCNYSQWYSTTTSPWQPSLIPHSASGFYQLGILWLFMPLPR